MDCGQGVRGPRDSEGMEYASVRVDCSPETMGENRDVHIDYLASCGVVETVVLKVSQSPAGDVCLAVIPVSENH